MIKAIVFDCFGVLIGIDSVLVGQPNSELFAYIRDELKPHYKIGMLSNAAAGVPQGYLTAEQLTVFDDVVVSGEVGYEKPQREIFQLVADRLNVPFDAIIFVDDLERYVLPARDMGIQSIQFTDLDSLKQQLTTLLA